jgi:hypothetical protein
VLFTINVKDFSHNDNINLTDSAEFLFHFFFTLPSVFWSFQALSATSHLLAFLQTVFLPEFYNTNIKSITWDVFGLRKHNSSMNMN